MPEKSCPGTVSGPAVDRAKTVPERATVRGSRSMQCAFYHGLGHPFLSAVLDKTPHIMAVKKANGELVVMPARKKAKHRIAKMVQ